MSTTREPRYRRKSICSGSSAREGSVPRVCVFWGFETKLTVRGWVVKGLLPPQAVLEKDTQLTEAEFREMLTRSEEFVTAKIGEIRQGRIEVAPADRDFCKRVCLFRDVCRIEP